MDFRDVGNFRILSWEVRPPDGGCHNRGSDGVATLAFLPSSRGGWGGSKVRGTGVRGGAGARRKGDSEGSCTRQTTWRATATLTCPRERLNLKLQEPLTIT